MAKDAQITDIKLQALHNPLNNYLQLLIGNSGKNYPNFNGQFAGVKFQLGTSAFINENKQILNKLKSTDL